ncbi:hypothetical protein ASE17_03510 [Phenylobacterium sp. Root77]|uniref:response regulator n=1 Tax=unclassified Phenylobacterium TaxID=2640670 RepID=UPI0007007E72|nr:MULTISPECIES: response regulator [unclassified Phenylobacterium]KQW71956.1 hypothetical protein ASC73_07735 [Phenylobacterium sp. Root1277]KQW94877.1 hypothetical protein ASC79_03880 [Phenylobacterium sp. Root1290]KRC44571.1 hypothetical protein ASE17_03510 [Phenylobacterium sp. Root77]
MTMDTGIAVVREQAYLDLCRAYDGLLEPEAPMASERVRGELAAYARILDLDVGEADAPEIWRRVRPLIAREFGAEAERLASTAPIGLAPKVYLPSTGRRHDEFKRRQEPLSLLVVEDDPDLGPAMVEALTEAGHRVVAHAIGAEVAISQAALHAIDLAIIDVELAEQSSGAELARVLFERWGTPALFISGSHNEHLVTQELAVGFLGKPFKAAELLAAITLATPLLGRNREGG